MSSLLSVHSTTPHTRTATQGMVNCRNVFVVTVVCLLSKCHLSSLSIPPHRTPGWPHKAWSAVGLCVSLLLCVQMSSLFSVHSTTPDGHTRHGLFKAVHVVSVVCLLSRCPVFSVHPTTPHTRMATQGMVNCRTVFVVTVVYLLSKCPLSTLSIPPHRTPGWPHKAWSAVGLCLSLLLCVQMSSLFSVHSTTPDGHTRHGQL